MPNVDQASHVDAAAETVKLTEGLKACRGVMNDYRAEILASTLEAAAHDNLPLHVQLAEDQR